MVLGEFSYGNSVGECSGIISQLFFLWRSLLFKVRRATVLSRTWVCGGVRHDALLSVGGLHCI